MSRHLHLAIGASFLAGGLAVTSPLHAQDFESLSKEQRKQILAAHVEIDLVDHILIVCDELAPGYAETNRAIMADYKREQLIDVARPVTDRFIAWLESKNAAATQALTLTLSLTRSAARAEIEKEPAKCQEAFKDELYEDTFENIQAVAEAYGEKAPDADVADASTDAAQAQASEPTAPALAQTSTETAAGDLPMPTPIISKGKSLPGLTWQMPATVEYASSGTVYCVWRCTVLQYLDESHPWLIIHEALPLPAEQAIDAVVAAYDHKPISRQQPVDASSYVGAGRLQADRVAARNVYIDDRGDRENRRSFVAWERDGLSVVTEFVYRYSNEPAAERMQALLTVLASLQMDTETIRASLSNPKPPSIISRKGEPPAADQVIYAKNPKPTLNALTLNTSYDRDARYFREAVLNDQGDILEMDGATYFYVPPAPEGTTIEGVFKSSSGYLGAAAQSGGTAALRTKTLIFNRDGRFSTSAASGLSNGSNAAAGAVTSGGSSSLGEGSYRIDGYTLELRLDDGTVRRQAFFPYFSKVFWPGSDAPGDEFNLINLGGTIMYRDD